MHGHVHVPIQYYSTCCFNEIYPKGFQIRHCLTRTACNFPSPAFSLFNIVRKLEEHVEYNKQAGNHLWEDNPPETVFVHNGGLVS